MAFVAADQMDKKGEKVADTANLITLGSAGTTGEVTAPVALGGGVISVIGKGLKGLLLSIFTDKSDAANSLYTDAAIGGITSVGGLKIGKFLSSKGIFTNNIQKNIMSASYDLSAKPLTSHKKRKDD